MSTQRGIKLPKKYTIGFNHTETITTQTDYFGIKIILQGTNKTQVYTLDKTAPCNYTGTLVTPSLKVGKYRRYVIGIKLNTVLMTAGEEEIISEDFVNFKANPLTTLRVKSFNETVLFNIEQYLIDPKILRHSQYKLDDRELKRYDLGRLLKIRDRYVRLVNDEANGYDSSISPRSVIYKF